MSLILRSLLGLALLARAALAADSYALDPKIHDAVPFKPTAGYLAMNVAYAPVAALFDQLEQDQGLRLITRGEAHITVLTPEEYSALAGVLGKAGINRIAQEADIQKSGFEAVCVGKGSARIGSKTESTFFIVVKSPGLLSLRQDLLDAYQEAGGAGEPFAAAHFYPHITIGYTKVDLHEEQGVVKDESSCLAALSEAP